MRDIFSGILFVIIGLIFFYNAYSYPIGDHSSPGPGYFPVIMAVILIVIGLILIIKILYGSIR